MLMPGGKKKKAAEQKKRPRPAPASSTSPHNHQQQQPQGMLPKVGGDQQQQPLQQQHNKKKKSKKEDKDAGMGLGAWIMLPGTERDIFVDRCQKEIAPLLGVLRTAGEGAEEDDDGAKPMDESDGIPSKFPDKKNKQKKRQKPRVKAFSAKEATAAHKYARKCICIGINEVTRALEKGQLSLLFICRDINPPRLVEHIAVLAALRGVPFFALPKATASLGQALGLQRVAALGFRTKEGAAAAAHKGPEDEREEMGNDNEEVVVQVQTRLQSFQAFLLAKHEYVNGGGGGGEGKEGGAANINMM